MKVHSVIFIVFPIVWRLAQSMQCYSCEADRSHDGKPACEHFDESSKYVIHCPHSTLCYKKIVNLQMANELSTTSIQRGCAPQTLNGEQEKVNGSWKYVHTIHEAYQVGCKHELQSGKPTKTTFCYCRGDLCNSTTYNYPSLWNLSFIVLLANILSGYL